MSFHKKSSSSWLIPPTSTTLNGSEPNLWLYAISGELSIKLMNDSVLQKEKEKTFLAMVPRTKVEALLETIRRRFLDLLSINA